MTTIGLENLECCIVCLVPQQPFSPTIDNTVHCITQYGSTVYIGIAMVYPH